MPPVKVLLVQWGQNITYATKRATDAGRKLTVAFIYYAETNTAYPITAWER
jgi:hypothetical protein